MIEPKPQLDPSLGAQAVRTRVSEAAFGSRLVANHLRGLVAEAIVASALEPEWTWCSADWAGWDFERADGLKLEVKQSASRQTWSVAGASQSASRFDIRARSGSYIGSQWLPGHGRAAGLYVFAHHFEAGDCADHCDPDQWRFYVVPEQVLSEAKTIGLRGIEKLATPCRIAKLARFVKTCSLGLRVPSLELGRTTG